MEFRVGENLSISYKHDTLSTAELHSVHNAVANSSQISKRELQIFSSSTIYKFPTQQAASS